jgi:general secretion pathway protein E
LVLSSLHTNDAPATITRLIDIGAQPYLIAATLLGVIAQRLIRTLCPHCRKPGPLDAAAWQSLVEPASMTAPKAAYHAVGCDECRHTGYRGRIGIYESLLIDDDFRTLINAGANLQAFHSLTVKKNLRTLRLSGALKIAEGLTTLEEVLSVVPPVRH